MKEPLTPRQQSVLTWIKSYITQHGFGPTYSEIAEAFDVSRTMAQGHIREIKRKGHVETTGAHRGIFIPKKK